MSINKGIEDKWCYIYIKEYQGFPGGLDQKVNTSLLKFIQYFWENINLKK